MEKGRHCWSGECDQQFIAHPDGDLDCQCIQAVLLHEILHGMGLGHVGGFNKDNGQDEIGNPCNDDYTYPNRKSDPMYWDIKEHHCCTSMCCYVECALKKLYCPSELSPNLGKRMGAESNSSCNLPCYALQVERQQDNSGSGLLLVYPTISKNEINIEVRNVEDPADLLIVDLTGRLFFIKHISPSHGHVRVRYDCSGMPSSAYRAILRLPHQQHSFGFIIAH